MTIGNVLRHDLTVLRRTLVGKLLLFLSIGATLGGTFVGLALSSEPLNSDFLVFSLWLVAGTVLPLGALLTAAVSIAADRESGRLRLLFGTPVTKTDVFVGTLLSRVFAICGAVIAGFALAGLIVSILSVDLSRSILELYAFTLLLCIVYTSVGLTVSVISSTRLRAVGTALVFYVWAAMWPQMVSALGGSDPTWREEPTSAETVSHFVGTLSPFGAYSQAATPQRAIYAEVVTGPLLATPTMSLILCVWAVVPIPIGYWWFSRTDL